MNLQKVLLGALLIKPELAPYALPNLEIRTLSWQTCSQYLPPYLASGMQGAVWTRWKPAPATQSSKRSSWNA